MSIRPGQRPRIFCIGLNKTGTKSLAQAFSMLGLRALHDARRATEAIERAAAQSRPLLTWIDDDDGYLDAPFHRWYRALDEQYPGSRFILNTREEASWVESRIAHDRRWNATRRPPDAPSRPCDPDRLLAFKRRKEAEILAYFAARPRHLLRLDVCAGQGWPELCGFLSLPLPRTADGEVAPFPCVRRRAGSDSDG
jgi:hypothetical protein